MRIEPQVPVGVNGVRLSVGLTLEVKLKLALEVRLALEDGLGLMLGVRLKLALGVRLLVFVGVSHTHPSITLITPPIFLWLLYKAPEAQK